MKRYDMMFNVFIERKKRDEKSRRKHLNVHKHLHKFFLPNLLTNYIQPKQQQNHIIFITSRSFDLMLLNGPLTLLFLYLYIYLYILLNS
jgi:hypothetical protein